MDDASITPLERWMRKAKSEPLDILMYHWDEVPEEHQKAVFNNAIASIDVGTAPVAVTVLASLICHDRHPAQFMIDGLKALVMRNPMGAVYAAHDYAQLPIAKSLLDYAFNNVDSDSKNDPILKAAHSDNLAEIRSQKKMGTWAQKRPRKNYDGFFASAEPAVQS